MKEENPFDKVFDQIADLLALIQGKKSLPSKKKSTEKPPYEDIEAQLEVLERGAEAFRAITDEAIRESGLSEESIQQSIQEMPSTLSSKERRILKRAAELKKESDKLCVQLEQKARIAKKAGKRKTPGRKRKKKFRRLGGQGWIPL
jgi:hypothetical protein